MYAGNALTHIHTDKFNNHTAYSMYGIQVTETSVMKRGNIMPRAGFKLTQKCGFENYSM